MTARSSAIAAAASFVSRPRAQLAHPLAFDTQSVAPFSNVSDYKLELFGSISLLSNSAAERIIANNSRVAEQCDEFRGNALEMSFGDENCGKLIIIFAH
jgi:hypothetical protein